MTGLLFVAFLVLFFSHLNLRDRVNHLEWERGIKDGKTVVAPAKVAVVPAIPLANQLEPTEFKPVIPKFTPQHTAEALAQSKPSPFVTWFKEHTLIKVGGVFFFLGAAWFVSFAISEGWLSPELRISLGFLLALAAYSLGFVRMKNSSVQYQSLTALGTGIVAATVLAAHTVFSLFPPVLSLFLLALSLAYTVYVAFSTRVLWLTMAAAVLGLLAPLMTGTSGDSKVLLPYLLILTVVLLLVGLRATWRPLTLLLLIGVLGYELALVDTTTPLLLFVFVVLFSLVFFASTTLSLIKTNEPHHMDVTTLSLMGLGYIYLASVLRPDATLAVFVATAVVSGVGYFLLVRQYPAKIVAVYLSLATVGILVGTSFLFSGFSLILAYIFEVTLAFLLVTSLGLPERTVVMSATLYLLPLFGSVVYFYSTKWEDGAWHSDALVVYVMLFSIVFSTLWLIHKPGVAIYKSSKTLAATFGIVSGAYAYAVAAIVVSSILAPAVAPVMTYLLWALISVSVMLYSKQEGLPIQVGKVVAATLALPVLASLNSFFAPDWSTGVYHIHGLGLLGITVILILATLLMTQQYYREYDKGLKILIGVGVTTTTLYLAAAFTTIWNNLLPTAVSEVAIYVSYTLILYLLVSILVLVRADANWIKRALLALSIPTLLSFNSFALTGWPAGPLSPDAIGLFVQATIAMLLGLGLKRKAQYVDELTKTPVFINWCKGLFVASLAYVVVLIWSMTHSAVEPAKAVSLSLFIYTVFGLYAYLFGKRYQSKDMSYVGVALLSIVVFRLMLVDVWNMELIWRVITFLGIGALFIAASLLERQPKIDNN